MTMPSFKLNNIFLPLCIIFLITGCAQIDRHIKTIKPTAKLVGTRLANINFDQADLLFDIAVKNKNPFSIPLSGVDYNLKVGGNSLISGITGQGIKIKSSTTSNIALPISLKFDDLRKIPGKLWKQDQVSYELDGSINIKLPVIGNYAIPFSRKGELPVPKMPSIQLKDLQVKDISLTSAKIVADIEIDNPNAFELGLSDFNYRLDINQKTWGEGISNKATSIPKKGKGVISIPLKLDLLSIGKAAFELLSGNSKIDYQLLGGITLDTGIEFLRQHKMPLNIKGTTSFK